MMSNYIVKAVTNQQTYIHIYNISQDYQFNSEYRNIKEIIFHNYFKRFSAITSLDNRFTTAI